MNLRKNGMSNSCPRNHLISVAVGYWDFLFLSILKSLQSASRAFFYLFFLIFLLVFPLARALVLTFSSVISVGKLGISSPKYSRIASIFSINRELARSWCNG